MPLMRRVLLPVLAATVLVGGLQVPAQAQSAGPAQVAPVAPEAARVPTRQVKPDVRPVFSAGHRVVSQPATVSWPAAGQSKVSLAGVPAGIRTERGVSASGAAASTTGGVVRVAPAPAQAGSDVQRGFAPAGDTVTSASVRVHGRADAEAAGIDGVIVDVARADSVRRSGAVTVAVDYSGFAKAYGADWATRLRLVQLPACALTTPKASQCATSNPLASTNDAGSQTVTAVTPLAADGGFTVLALTAGPSGNNGSYNATSLSPASTWQVSAQTGAFSWSYPFRMVPGVGGPQPSLSLSYSSQAIDGRTSTTNTQGSWIGDGWDMWTGYIERTYKSCASDTGQVGGSDPNNKTNPTGDQCWWKSNGTMSLNGRSTELVDAGGGKWRGKSDDGSLIELLTNTGFGNGDADGEYWKVTTVDGTQYFFGRNHGVGGATASEATNSAWLTQVYGNHVGEPGYTAGNFAASRRTQAWRWNLDYVVDPHGNTMTLFYGKETGAYGRESDPAKRTTYDRGGYLTKIEYASRNDAPATTQPGARVLFAVNDRCVTSCYSSGDPVAANWPDTPWDQYCKAAPCTNALSPTYWTSQRLTRVSTQVYSGSGTAFNDVEWWDLHQDFLNAGVSEGTPMWLRSIDHTGKVTTAGGAEASDPPITFNPGADPLANRVDGPTDGRTNLFRFRIQSITTESGTQIGITYSAKECTRTALPTPDTNTKRCYPQMYAPDGVNATVDWFHKYVVTRLDEHDQTGASADMQTEYFYLDTPAWHYDDSELVKPEERTWGQFRGYSHVQISKGKGTDPRLVDDYLYYRGMDGDKLSGGGTRTVKITDSQGVQVDDRDELNGQVREETKLDSASSLVVSSTITDMWVNGPTATSGSLKAWMVQPQTRRERTRLLNGTYRWTKQTTGYNTDGLPETVDDFGDEAASGDETCTRTWYARNSGNWMLDQVKRMQTVGVACAATPSVPADVLSDVRTTYDDVANDWNTDLPVLGDVAKVEEVDSWNGTNPVTVLTAKTTYDANGRPRDSFDAAGYKTSTTYTPMLAGPVTGVSVTNAKNQTSSTTSAPAWGLPATIIDANGAVTALDYDGLGRLLKVWQPGRDKGTYPQTPNLEYVYLLRNNAPTAVTTKMLLPTGSGYATQITLFDGWLRQRQTQTQAPGGGRGLTDTIYDSRGLTAWTAAGYYDASNAAPSTALYTGLTKPSIPSVSDFFYDSVGRKTAEALSSYGVEQWRSQVQLFGDRTTTIPPDGGTATTTILDADGRTTQLRQYHDRAFAGSDDPTTFDATNYTYTDRGELDTVTDPAGNTWNYDYDQRGHQTDVYDPDTGHVHTEYNDLSQVESVTDATGITLGYAYDALGRKTSVTQGGNIRTTWEYDTLTNGIGRLTRSTRLEPAGSANAYTNEVTGYDIAGRVTSSKLVVPSGEGTLCASGTLTPCEYTYSTSYKADGQPSVTSIPAAADLGSEVIAHNYNDVGAPTTLTTSLSSNVYAVTYNKLGMLTERKLGKFGSLVTATYTIDEATNRTTDVVVSPDGQPVPASYHYTYDKTGNLLSIKDSPFGQTADTQCYTYDHLRRLTQAWTPLSGDCGATRTVSGLGGPAPYWHSYAYTGSAGLAGSRTQETWHESAGDTVRDYTYPTQGGPVGSQPHTVQQVVTDRPGTGNDTTDLFDYDANGNTTLRDPAGPASQQLAWDPEGHLKSVTDGAGTTDYIYDADGNRLISHDPTGATLYLPGGQEVRRTTGQPTKATRYYNHLGTIYAVRTAAGLTWQVADHHGTSEVGISATNLANISRRRSTPFGTDRGTPPATWAGDKGFVGGTRDNTGLTHLGAREYDPALGMFLSDDPVSDPGDPQQLHGYAYSNNNPTSFSDPSGLYYTEDSDDTGAKGYGHSNGPTTVVDKFVPPPCDAACQAARAERDRKEHERLERERLERERARREREAAERAKIDDTWWKQSMDWISDAAPALDLLAAATAAVPGLDIVTATLAVAVNIVSVANGAIDVWNDIQYSTTTTGTETAFDVAGTVLSAVGLGATAKLAHAEKGLAAAAKEASKTARTLKNLGSPKYANAVAKQAAASLAKATVVKSAAAEFVVGAVGNALGFAQQLVPNAGGDDRSPNIFSSVLLSVI
ncbi:hypothetical protein Cs7R123_49920 [Catellatospora sp. TT07R-123]|nr:hypothetical protein Cs7R123_49920 [Catellatospora sp. TT07R-123]